MNSHRGGTSRNHIEVSVVIPCLNEALTVGPVVTAARQALESHGVVGEVIVADNGSTDGSVAIAEAAGAVVVAARRRGYGSAIRAGCAAAEGRLIVTGDADGAHDLGQLVPIVERLRAGDEFVMGTRLKGTILPGAMPWHHRYIGNPIHAWIVRRLFHTKVTDPHCGLRGFTRDAYERMDCRMAGFELTTEMVIKAAKLGLRTSEVPITHHPAGRGRPPHLRPFRDGWRTTKFMLMFSPTALFLVPGLGLILVGMGMMAAQLFAPADRPLSLFGFRFDIHWAILGSLLSIVGYQIVTVHFFARVYSVTHRMREDDMTLRRALRVLTLDRVLILASLVIIAGIVIDGFVVLHWLRPEVGLLSIHTRLFVLGSTLLAIGVQTFFNAFFFSILGGAYQADQTIERPRARGVRPVSDRKRARGR